MLLQVSRLQCFERAQEGGWRASADMLEKLQLFEQHESEGQVGAVDGGDGGGGARNESGRRANLGLANGKAVRDMLYSVGNLRKRPGADE